MAHDQYIVQKSLKSKISEVNDGIDKKLIEFKNDIQMLYVSIQ